MDNPSNQIPQVRRRKDFSEDEIKQLQKIYKKIPAPSPVFDKFDLRFTTDVIAKLGKDIIFLPLEDMALFVTKRVKDNVVAGVKMPLLPNEVLEKCYNMISAVSIGNAAYTLLGSKHKNERTSAMNNLNRIYQLEFDIDAKKPEAERLLNHQNL